MKIYNTLSGTKEHFTPQGDVVKMYVCGVTPYSETHIGHAMSNIIFDVIRRYLLFQGHRVKYVQNVTDVDDKIIERAAELQQAPDQLAREYTRRFFEDMDRLNVMRADASPRATESIPSIVEMVQGLIHKGHAYESKGSVYFRVRGVSDYGKLSRRSVEFMITDRSAEWGENKEHPMDFALWKAAKAGEPSWNSPWGPGRPGWHIECSAMALATLGETLDIHGGGLDLIFPHHENEVAQSESYTGVKPFARYWVHNGLLHFDKEKMSKSLGNLLTVREALTKNSPDGLRIFVLSSHYRNPLSYSDEALQAAEKNADRLRQVMAHDLSVDTGADGIDAAYFSDRFVEAMDDDFNTSRALVVLYELAKEINRRVAAGSGVSEAQSVLRQLSGVLGLTLESVRMESPDTGIMTKVAEVAGAYAGKYPSVSSADTAHFEGAIDSLVALRNELRQAKQWQQADAVRKDLEGAGVILEDTTKGTKWKITTGMPAMQLR